MQILKLNSCFGTVYSLLILRISTHTLLRKCIHCFSMRIIEAVYTYTVCVVQVAFLGVCVSAQGYTSEWARSGGTSTCTHCLPTSPPQDILKWQPEVTILSSTEAVHGLVSPQKAFWGRKSPLPVSVWFSRGSQKRLWELPSSPSTVEKGSTQYQCGWCNQGWEEAILPSLPAGAWMYLTPPDPSRYATV